MTRSIRSALGALFLSVVLPLAAAQPLPPELGLRIYALAEAAGGTVGVSVVHLPSGRSASLNSAERFQMASVYKLPIALAVLGKVDAGTLDLGDPVEMKAGDLRPGPGLSVSRAGLVLTVRELVQRMMIESDNTATDVLLRRLGGPKVVGDWLRARGLEEIDVSWTELETNALYNGVTGTPKDGDCSPGCLSKLVAAVPAAEREKAVRRFEADPRNTASPDALTRLLVKLARGQLLAAPSTTFLLDTMRRCRTGDARIRGLLPPGTVVADKTGTIGRVTNDVGIVELPGDAGRLVIAVLVKDSDRPVAEREKAIAGIARAAYDVFMAAPPGGSRRKGR